MAKIECKCGAKFTLPASTIGKAARCAKCTGIMRFIAAGASAAEPTGRLLVESGPSRLGEQFFFFGEGSLAFGKGADQPLLFPGAMVSRHHCTFIADAGGWRVDDHASTNGLYVNQERVQSHELCDGDVLDIGDYTVRFRAISAVRTPVAVAAPAESSEPDDLYGLSEAPPEPPKRAVVRPAPAALTGPTCPHCNRTLPANGKICVACGIDVKTGRRLVTSHGVDENVLYVNTQNVLRLLSWILPLGWAPIASEASGKHKPYAIWTISALTVLVTVSVWCSNLSIGDRMAGFGPTKNLMLWTGDKPNPHLIEAAYLDNPTDDAADAFVQKKMEYMQNDAPDSGAADMPAPGRLGADGEDMHKLVNELTIVADDPDSDIKAYQSLPTEYQKLGEFHFYQLLTNAFLHGGIVHIAGNLLFLLVFGNRVNALLGQAKAAILYVVLAVLASTAFFLSNRGQPVMPALGASGAIMGMAGMYFVLFPVNKVYMVVWARLGLLTGFRRFTKIFSLRGFWVLLFYIAFDVLATLRGSHDGTAHWAHLGGFIAGMAIATLLLITRQINAHGGDLISLLLGKRAWAIVGNPMEQEEAEAKAAELPRATSISME